MSDEKQYLKRKKIGINENQTGCKITFLGMRGRIGGGFFFNTLAEKESEKLKVTVGYKRSDIRRILFQWQEILTGKERKRSKEQNCLILLLQQWRRTIRIHISGRRGALKAAIRPPLIYVLQY